MMPLRRRPRITAIGAALCVASWLLASNHCAIASLETATKTTHACCQEDGPARPTAPMVPAQCCALFNVPVPEHVAAPAGNFFELPIALERAIANFELPSLRDGNSPVRTHDPPPTLTFAATVLNRSLLTHAPPVFVA